MILAVLQVCFKHALTWTGLVPYKTAHDELKANVASIENATQVQENVLVGIALDKRFKKDAMVKKTLEVAQGVFAYAEDQGDVILRAQVDFSKSDLLKERDAVIGQVCQNIHDTSNGVIASLGAYGLVAADLVELQAGIDAYVAVIASPRTAVTVRKGATAEIDALVKDSMKILNNRMDMLMPEFETSAPEFFQEYFDARIIIDLGGKEEKPEAEADAA